ncbi:hypothetical protein [Arthrobacter methylotrophus]|uniref:hypothetical protein n=1 Tax=Arthrobacter methylotrophus TaxID=121291 RepID=UPI0031E74942
MDIRDDFDVVHVGINRVFSCDASNKLPVTAGAVRFAAVVQHRSRPPLVAAAIKIPVHRHPISCQDFLTMRIPSRGGLVMES